MRSIDAQDIKNEGPAYGLHIQESKTNVWWPKLTPSRLKDFDCNVLHDEKGEPETGITLFGAGFGSPNYIRAHFKTPLALSKK